MFTCGKCAKGFTRADSLKRHEKTCMSAIKLSCTICEMQFTRQDSLKKHMTRQHAASYICERCGEVTPDGTEFARHMNICGKDEVQPPAKKMKIADQQTAGPSAVKTAECKTCGESFSSLVKYSGHLRSQKHLNAIAKPYNANILELETSFKHRVATYRINGGGVDILSFLESVKQPILGLINTVSKSHYSGIKFNMELFGHYVSEKNPLGDLKSFNTQYIVITSEMINISNIYDEQCSILKTKSEEFQLKDSGWRLMGISHIEVNINKYTPIRGSSFIELPPQIRKKHACVNVKNNDNACFGWAVVSALHSTNQNTDRPSSYPNYADVLNIDGIDFPMKLKDIGKFETNNNLSINVYGLDFNYKSKNYDIVGPIYYTKSVRPTHVNLLYIEEGTKGHYVWIKDMSRLVSSQISTRKEKKFLCDGCLTFFTKEAALLRHKSYDCNKVHTVMPTDELKLDKNGDMVPGNILKFNSYEKKMRVPFVVYADFESLQKPICTTSPNPDHSYTNKTHIHVPYSFGYYIKCSYNDTLSKYETYTGEDCAQVFMKRLCDDVESIYNNHLKIVRPMPKLNPQEQHTFDTAVICHICDKTLAPTDKVADHNHLTSEFVGAAHSKCNLNYKIPKMIPVFFHNMSNYDAHLFIKELGCDNEQIDIIPQNKEKYISFTKTIEVDKFTDKNNKPHNVYMKLRFLDSFRFMSSSLDKLAKNLNDSQLCEIRKFFPTNEEFNLTRRKGVFPYQYMDSFERLSDQALPPKREFYNILNKENITTVEYEHALNVWSTFNCINISDYSNLYLKIDVLLLCDTVEQFRNVCMSTYKLDPAQYFTIAGLSWDAMLKYTKVELELFTDIDMYHFVHKGIRGGICQASLRHAKANNKYMKEYNPKHPSTYLAYWDANNLYGWAMSQLLPCRGFSWLDQTEISNFNVNDITDNSPEGYFLEVDVSYPVHLHHYHNELPFLPQNISPPNSRFKNKKLIPNLGNKKNYVIHYKNLKQALKHGLKLTKIHRILKFNQSAWLKSYIDLNTQLRQNAMNDFEKDFFKLMNNSIYGKTMENVDKRVDVKLVNHWEDIGKRRGAESLIAKPNMKSVSIFTENLIAVHLEKLKVLYNKPIYAGFAILELSKHLMYDFYYEYVKPTYQDRATLCYIDTDSFILLIETEDLYRDIKDHNERFDTSNFKPNNVYGIPMLNKAKVGLMKDEAAGRIIHELVALRPKLYAFSMYDEEIRWTKKAKGVKRGAIKHDISGADYKTSMIAGSTLFVQQNLFRTYKHQIYTINQSKIALSINDDKRFICSDGCSTLAWGNILIAE